MSDTGKQRTALVTGGAGFIGSHLCDALIQAGWHVVCLDNFSSGSLKNVQHLIPEQKFTLIEADIRQPIDYAVDTIFNLACPASPVQYMRDPIATTTTCVLGAINCLNLATKLNVPVVHSSTSEVYGDPKVSPQPEIYWGNVNPIGPRACYDEGKRCAETLFFDYRRQHKTTVRVARIFNTYGPRMAIDDGRVVSNFIVNALRGDPLEIYGNPEITRSFCFVDDMVQGLIALSVSDECGPVNLGRSEEITIGKLAEKIIELTGSSSDIIVTRAAQDDPQRRLPDTQRALSALNWRAETELAHGLTNTINYFQCELGDRNLTL